VSRSGVLRASASRDVVAALGVLAGAACLAATPRDAVAQEVPAAPACLPFGPGEVLTYSVRVSLMGARGRNVMSVEGPTDVRGREAYVLKSSASVGIGPVRGTDRTTSWLDPARFAALRFVQHQRNVLSRDSDSVEINLEERRWRNRAGKEGAVESDAPLDELSFIYFIRTLPLGSDSAWSFRRHFDADRNPTDIRVTGRDTLDTPAGKFNVIEVKMRVRDRARYDGIGTIRLSISDDARRIPVRIRSVVPVAGSSTMTLASIAGPTPSCGAARVGSGSTP